MPGPDRPPLRTSVAAAPPSEELAAAALAVARRFSAGATMWCWSGAWPHHAQHVAVEFVHPVIVGKRALPAEAVAGADPVGALRAVTRPGDLLLAVAAGTDPAASAIMRRAPAWGVESVWIGVGPRPPAGSATHVLWLDDEAACHTGDVVLLYHLLWELTHVCFEHPGLLDVPLDGVDVCITCGDEGRLAEVVTTPTSDVATVRTPAGREDIDTSLVGPLRAGDLVLVHAGTAIQRLGDDER